ncbi:MAG TPA: glutamate--cysteine ligase [Thiobacillaceae bacterium]|nr:glutamate--cysteine ligase [Thiobacillaceae bacterium]
MGQEIAKTHFSDGDFALFRTRLATETDALIRLAAAGGIDDPRLIAGFELEAWLLDHAGDPKPANKPFLAALADPLVVPELSLFNVELNGAPVPLQAGALRDLEEELADTWARAQAVAHGMDTMLAMIGILPTVGEGDMTLGNMTDSNRYVALNEQVLKARQGRPVSIHIDGRDSLRAECPDVMLEAATTSFQIHLQVPEPVSGRYFNAMLAISAPLLAVSVNSPLLFGRRLWQETRIPLFEQSVELGGYAGLGEDSVRRVGFGQGYVGDSIVELFAQNERLYPVLLPMSQDAAPQTFAHLRLHNGSIWRWVRPLVGFDATGRPHVRIEQRVLPSGPTLIDMMSNMAFCLGLAHALAHSGADLPGMLPFAVARDNFYAAARHGLAATLQWPAGRERPVRALLLEELLPISRSGLERLGVSESEIRRALGVIEARAASGRTGADWQLDRLERVDGDVRRLVADYLENQRSGAPVHEWT